MIILCGKCAHQCTSLFGSSEYDVAGAVEAFRFKTYGTRENVLHGPLPHQVFFREAHIHDGAFGGREGVSRRRRVITLHLIFMYSQFVVEMYGVVQEHKVPAWGCSLDCLC